MMLNKLVPNVILVFTTVMIYSIGIISSQDELEHGLATNCSGKSMKTKSQFQMFSKFDDRVLCFFRFHLW